MEDLCRQAGCDKGIYYRAFRKPEFVALYHRECIEATRKAVGPVINACVREAVRGSYQHAKIVLAMAGLYVERQEISGPRGGAIPIRQIETLTDEELLSELKRLESIGEIILLEAD